MIYSCLHCSRTFATPYALKRHISDKHQYVNEEEGESSRSNIPYEEPGLWDDLPINYSEDQGLWDEDLPMNYSEDQMVRVIIIVLKISIRI
jgi:Zinc finger, C2H2 type